MASFLEFLRTGRFDQLALGITPGEVMSRYGRPSNWYRGNEIWVYGCLQVFFARHVRGSAGERYPLRTNAERPVWLMGVYFTSPPALDEAETPAELRFDDWPTTYVSEAETQRRLREAGIPWTARGLMPGDTDLDRYLLPSGVELLFYPEEDGERELAQAMYADDSLREGRFLDRPPRPSAKT